MTKFADLVSHISVSGRKNKVSEKIVKEVARANAPVKHPSMTKAEKKALDKHFEELNKKAREREIANANKAKEKAKKRREEKATANKQ